MAFLKISAMLLVMTICISGAYADAFKCEQLPTHICAFSVSTSGNRCVLEKSLDKDGKQEFTCMSSVVMAENFAQWVENDFCIDACGLDRMWIGLSTDSLTDSRLLKNLCSLRCIDYCPNVIQLFTDLAAGEGIALKNVCNAANSKSYRRMMADMGIWASPEYAYAPAPVPY